MTETRDPATPPATPPQVIPRPPTARPGEPSPWEGLDPGARRGISLDAVLGGLERAGQSGPAPSTAGDSVGPWVEVGDRALAGTPSPSAVLAPLFEEDGEARVVLTRRSSRLRSHRGEVSFPGGRVDPGEDVHAAALREAHEEVALDPAAVRFVGWLHPILTFVSGSLIEPVVGVLAVRPALEANPAEVARVFDVALADLVADGVFHEERWSFPGRGVRGAPDGSIPMWFYEVAGEIVWGATARMLTELLTLVLGVGPVPR